VRTNSERVVDMATNWTKIKNEYINGGCTYQSLADKYGVSFSMIEKRGRREKWRELKAKQSEKLEEKLREKTAEKIADVESDVAAIMSRIRLKLTVKIEQAVDNLEEVDTVELRKLVQSYKDMSEAQSGTEDDRNGMLNDILDAVRGVDNG
jgi:flagellar motility protein MotE (MotC chaperone)